MQSLCVLRYGENGEIPPLVKRVNDMHRLISFFELLGAYSGVILRTPSWAGNKDLDWLDMPTVAGNAENDYIL